MKALIISNGQILDDHFYENLIAESDLIICADGGAKHAERMGIIPDVLLGDLDSIGQHCFNNVKNANIKYIQYSTDKDKTDTQLAVEFAIEKGCKEIFLIGSLGTRFDHSFANVSLLKYILDQGAMGTVINEHNEIHTIDSYIKLQGKIGDIISLLPITKIVEGISTTGLQYALQNAQMTFGVPNGVSNVFSEEEAEIHIQRGLLLVIKARETYNI